MINHDAIYRLNPSVVSIAGDVAYDKDGNIVAYDKQLVANYIGRTAYKSQREGAYPPITDYLDAVVKGDQAQIDKYISDCKAVKAKYPKV